LISFYSIFTYLFVFYLGDLINLKKWLIYDFIIIQSKTKNLLFYAVFFSFNNGLLQVVEFLQAQGHQDNQ